jgi:hypothetical protein
VTDQPTPATPDTRPLAARFRDALTHSGPGYDLTPPCLTDACTMDCTTECGAAIQQAWEALRRPEQSTPAAPVPFPRVQGHCPACSWDSLFLGTGGYVTCSRIECPDPTAASNLLEASL